MEGTVGTAGTGRAVVAEPRVGNTLSEMACNIQGIAGFV